MLIDGVCVCGVGGRSQLFEILFILHFLQQPYEILIIFIFPLVSMAYSHLLSWAPPKSFCVFLVVLKGGSGVGGPRVPWTNMTDLNVELGVLYPFHLLSCPRTLEWAIPTGHSSLLLCNVAAAAGYCCGDSPALEVPDCGVYVWVCVWRWCLFFFFFLKSHCRHCQHSPKSPLDSLWK